MPFKEAFTLGPFSVDAVGQLTPISRDSPPGFSVCWRGRVVHARLVHAEDREGHLSIQATMGRVPSTAIDPAARTEFLTVLRGLLRELPETWRVRLLPDHRPMVEVETLIGIPITATGLIGELTAFLLDLSPYLDLLDEAGGGFGLNGNEAR